MSIRPARADDRRAWAAMRAVLWPDASADEHGAEIDAITARDDLVCFVALDKGAAVGFAEAAIRRDPVNGCDTSPVGFLEGIYVAPEHRRVGVAGVLLTAVEQWAAANGCVELGSDSEEANADGHAFHLGAGFAERERVVFYRKLL